MADDTNSVAGLVRSLLADTRDLLREELALMRAEVREEVAQLRSVAVSFAIAAVAGAIAAVLLCIALGSAIAYFLEWPVWTGYGIVAVLLALAAVLFVSRGRSEMANVRALPKTRETVKENVEWIQSKSDTK
jgi:hypothetical protein